MNPGENIFKYRKQAGMSQGDLADELEVSRQSVSKWETGAAVPELDKLVKMSALFGISLDELVGIQTPQAETQPTSAARAEPVKIVIHQQPFHLSKQVIIGAVLLICALILSQILSGQGRFDVPEILLMMAPLVLSGILCVATRHPGFYCGWIAVIGYWIWFFLLTARWEEEIFLILLGITLVCIMVFLSIRIHRKGILHIPVWLWAVGGILLVSAGILLLLNTVPPFWISSSSAPISPG